MSEKRLIDANALKKRAYPFPCAIGTELAVPIRAIDKATTIDAVEVVRCGDCRNMWTWVCKDGSSRLLCMRTGTPEGYGGSAVKADHFCSHGKRKETTDE